MNHEHRIRENLTNDRNLDFPLYTSVTKEVHDAAKVLAQREHGGNMAALLRSCLVSALKQRYLLAE